MMNKELARNLIDKFFLVNENQKPSNIKEIVKISVPNSSSHILIPKGLFQKNAGSRKS